MGLVQKSGANRVVKEFALDTREKGETKMDRQVVSFEMVTHVEVVCDCGTAVAVPVIPKIPEPRTERKVVYCPVCGNDLPTGFLAAVEFRNFRERAETFIKQKPNCRLELRIAEQSASEPAKTAQ